LGVGVGERGQIKERVNINYKKKDMSKRLVTTTPPAPQSTPQPLEGRADRDDRDCRDISDNRDKKKGKSDKSLYPPL
jgi:hypothetical protein